MSSFGIIVTVFVLALIVIAMIAFFGYRKSLHKAKGIERGLKMVPLLIHLPPPGDDTTQSNRNIQDIMREKVSQAEVLYSLIAGTARKGFNSGRRALG